MTAIFSSISGPYPGLAPFEPMESKGAKTTGYYIEGPSPHVSPVTPIQTPYAAPIENSPFIFILEDDGLGDRAQSFRDALASFEKLSLPIFLDAFYSGKLGDIQNALSPRTWAIPECDGKIEVHFSPKSLWPSVNGRSNWDDRSTLVVRTISKDRKTEDVKIYLDRDRLFPSANRPRDIMEKLAREVAGTLPVLIADTKLEGSLDPMLARQSAGNARYNSFMQELARSFQTQAHMARLACQNPPPRNIAHFLWAANLTSEGCEEKLATPLRTISTQFLSPLPRE